MATENKREEKNHKGALQKCLIFFFKSTQLLRTNSFKKKLEKGSLRRGKGALQHPKQNRTEQHWIRTEWKMTTQKKGEEKKHSNMKESHKSG